METPAYSVFRYTEIALIENRHFRRACTWGETAGCDDLSVGIGEVMRELLREPIDAVLDEAGALVDAQVARLDGLRERLSHDELAALDVIVAAAAGDVDAWRARLGEIDGDRI